MPKEPGIIQSLLWFLRTWFVIGCGANYLYLCFPVFMWRCRNPTLPSETVTEPSTSTQTQPSLINGGGRHTGNRLQYIFMQETSFLAWHFICVVLSVFLLMKIVLTGCLAIGRMPLVTWQWPVSWTMMMRPVPCWKKSNQRYLCQTLVYDPSTKTAELVLLFFWRTDVVTAI